MTLFSLKYSLNTQNCVTKRRNSGRPPWLRCLRRLWCCTVRTLGLWVRISLAT